MRSFTDRKISSTQCFYGWRRDCPHPKTCSHVHPGEVVGEFLSTYVKTPESPRKGKTYPRRCTKVGYFSASPTSKNTINVGKKRRGRPNKVTSPNKCYTNEDLADVLIDSMVMEELDSSSLDVVGYQSEPESLLSSFTTSSLP